MKKSTLLFICVFILSIQTYSQLNWTALTDYPSVRYAPYAFMLDGRFFLGGGAYIQSPLTTTNDLMEYNFQTDAWEARASLPAGIDMYDERQFVINGLGYTTCGQLVPTSGGYMVTLYQYDPNQDKWNAKAAFPGTPRYTPYTFSIGNLGFLGMGYIANSLGNHWVNDFWQYDPDADAWTSIASYPGAGRQSGISFVINGMAYVGLGASSNTTFLNDMYRYDTASTQWTQMASFPGSARANCTAIVLNNIGYVIGGVNANQVPLSDIWSYTPSSNTWALVDSFSGLALSDIVSGSNGSFAVAGTGRDSSGNLSNKVYKTGTTTGINDVKTNTPRVWYNADKLHITFNEPLSIAGTLAIYDIEGRQVASMPLAKSEASFDVSLNTYTSGMYVYSIQSSQTNTTGKIIIGAK